MRQRGFTVIELITAVIILFTVATIFIVQKSQFESMQRDETRRTAINAMYYSLEDVFFLKNNYYPKTISEKNLTAMDGKLFTDPNGKKIGTPGSDYKYEPLNCEEDMCKGYTLHAALENEAGYVKTNRTSD